MTTNIRHKRKLSLLDNSNQTTNHHHHHPGSTLTKRFRGIAYDGKLNQNEHRMSLLSSTIKSEQGSKKMTIVNGEQKHIFQRFDESEMTPVVLAEYRRLQHELQCQEALLVLMQKLKTNQKLISQTNTNNSLKQRTTITTTPTPPTTATKLSQQSPLTDGKTPLTATKQSLNNSNRTIPTKPPHPNQYTVNRSTNHSQQQSSKNSLSSSSQATRQSNNNPNSTLPAAATRISSTVPTTATKNSSVTSSTSNSSKSNGVAAEQHLLNAKLALRKQLEQTLLQIPTPKPSTCDLTFIPGVNGWSEFLTYLGLEQALNTYTDIVNRRPTNEISFNLPYVCAQCGTDWSVTWHEMSSNSDTNTDDKILCDRCTKTSQKKLLKQDHSNRLRQAFIKALQQEKELDAKFQQQSSSSSSTTTITTTTATTTAPTNTVKQSSSSSSSSQQQSKHAHQTSKHSTKPLSTKTSSNHHHHHHHHTNNSTNNNHHHSHSHHHHSGKSSSSSKSHNTNSSTIPTLTPSPAETLASTLAALQSNEQMEFFSKHFLSNMLPFAVANQTAAALVAKSSHHQQQQQAALAALPAMAASLMRQPNPAQYLLDMIPQAAKQQQQQHHHHHHHHSK
jgi:DNA-directed RNA polymerase subunit RPC12/RpoP